jgi:hypothetical protein
MLSTPHVFKSQHHMDGEQTCRSGHPASLLIHHEPRIHSCSMPNYNSDGPYNLRYKRRPACRIQVSTPAPSKRQQPSIHFPLSPSRPTAANIMRTSMLLASLTSLLAVPAALSLSVPRASSVQFTFSKAPAVGACGTVYKDSDNVST